jgi:hypothetical protein
MHVGYWWESQTESGQDVRGWIVLKWILERQGGVVWSGLIWFRIGTSGNENLGSVKFCEILVFVIHLHIIFHTVL